MVNMQHSDLLIFDKDSPLFIKKKPKNIVVKTTTNKTQPKIKNPNDCKHILAAFKSKLLKAWDILNGDNIIKASEVASYINGVATVVKHKRPKEYQELKELVKIAKDTINKRNA